ncbi:response regulator [Halospeciosus flavus]|uniref:Response regulator n=2 Tax=Halospeciosus flavus TaxID=3032283 RepID=A0ABD5Z2A0_9EURY|nr:response regulator [Halospeciosus flavus]
MEGIRVLYVGREEDVDRRAAALRDHEPGLTVDTATSGSGALDALSERTVDCVVSEYDLGGIDGLGLLNLVRDTDPAIPFVLLVFEGSEQVASEAISADVTDYVPVGEDFEAALDDLGDTIYDRAEYYQAEQDVAMLNDLARNVYERITDAFFALDREWRFTYLNEEAERLLDVRAEDVMGENIWETFPDAVGTTFYTEYHRAIATQEAVTFDEYFEPLGKHFEVRAFPAEDGLSVHFRRIREGEDAAGDHLLELTNVLTYDLVDSIQSARDALERAEANGADAEELEDVENALDRMDDLIDHSVTLTTER